MITCVFSIVDSSSLPCKQDFRKQAAKYSLLLVDPGFDRGGAKQNLKFCPVVEIRCIIGDGLRPSLGPWKVSHYSGADQGG